MNHGVDVNDIGGKKIVFPRNRAIPFGDFLESEIKNFGSTLINTYEEHQFVSDSTKWRGKLRHGIKYWTEEDLDNLSDADGPFFVKGETNALKNDWDKYCYASDKERLIEIIKNNKEHPLIQNQKIIIQPFLNFKKLGINDDNGQPVINEWRYFCLSGEVMACGFYWSRQKIEGEYNNKGALNVVKDTLQDIEGGVNYVAVDVAQLETGEWRVIELNDGNMSGLCGVDEEELWSNIKKKIEK